MRKKFQTSVRPDGSTNVVQLGFVSEERMDTDRENERDWASKMAMREDVADPTQEIIETETTLVRIFKSGTVRVTHWVAETE